MNDLKAIRHQLWISLDMAWVRFHFGLIVAVSLIFSLLGSSRFPDNPGIFPAMLLIVLVPFLIFLACRTYAIFEKAEDYYFCKTKLDTPFGGFSRDSIGFHVTVTDPQGLCHRVDTRSIFHTRSVIGANLEDYVNHTVTVAHNPTTGSVVVIG